MGKSVCLGCVIRPFVVCILTLTFVLFCFQNCKEVNYSEPESDGSALVYGKVESQNSNLHTNLLLKRLTGLVLPKNHEFYLQVNQLIESDRYDEAVHLITDRDEFYNITVRDFATKMSVASEVTTAPLSDFVATVVGIARDEIGAQEMLTGNFYYKGKKQTGIRENIINDIVKSNNHYEDLDKLDVNLRQSLEKVDGQKAYSENRLVDLEDAAGVLTSRAFMMAHAFEGTNRRIIEYSMSQFLCSPISDWADGTLSDSYIGRDIGRSPKVEYDTKCKTCHAPMDAFRPATAHFDFVFSNPRLRVGNIVYKTKTTRQPSNEDPKKNVVVEIEEQLVPNKFRRGSDNFKFGYKVISDDWFNLLLDDNKFGWQSNISSGKGMNKFGELLANTDAFAECMTKRAFKVVCKRHPKVSEDNIVQNLALDFQNNNYSLRKLFESVALSTSCLGVVY